MTYLFLALAILFEVAWAIGVKYVIAEGKVQVGPTIFTLVTYLLSIVFLTVVVQRMSISTAYAVWAGSGAAIIGLIGIFYFHEPRSMLRVISLALVVLGVVGLNLTEGPHGAGKGKGKGTGAGAPVEGTVEGGAGR